MKDKKDSSAFDEFCDEMIKAIAIEYEIPVELLKHEYDVSFSLVRDIERFIRSFNVCFGI